MKAHLLIFAAALLISCWAMPPKKKASASKGGASASKGGASASGTGASASGTGASASGTGASASGTSGSIPLDMVPESVDDDYEGCTAEMEKKVEEEYKEENVREFARFWANQDIADCSNKPVSPEVLTKNHRKAICLQTSKYMTVDFNTAVRTGKNIYGSTFPFNYFHYWLTTAVQILNRIQKSKDQNNPCQTTYRRTKDVFTGNKGDIIRFGMFASSSTKQDLVQYGSETCFKIKTCFGAYVGDYELYQGQEEVLIPPYETFEITSDKGKVTGCDKVFVLQSTGEQSNLRCKLIHK